MATTMNPVLLEPQSAAWHVWRAGGLGGSDAPIIAADAGLCKPASWMKSIEEMWKIKTGRASDISTPNFGMRKGIRSEPRARAAFEKNTGILLSPIYGEMAAHSFVRSSFDGVDMAGDFIGEIKYGSKYIHDLAKAGEVVDYYRPQLAHQALTAWGMPDEWQPEHMMGFVTYIPETDDLAYVIKPAFEYRELAEKLVEAEVKFWNKVLSNAEPVSDEWRGAAARFLNARAQIEQLVKEEEEAKAVLIAMAGGNDKKVGAGVSVTRQIRKGNVDYGKLLKELTTLTEDQIEVYRKADSSSIVVRAVSVRD